MYKKLLERNSNNGFNHTVHDYPILYVSFVETRLKEKKHSELIVFLEQRKHYGSS